MHKTTCLSWLAQPLFLGLFLLRLANVRALIAGLCLAIAG